MDLLPELRELPNLDAKVFLFLTALANYSREPVGVVEMSITAIADSVGTSRGSLRRALTRLEKTGIIHYDTGSPRSTERITMIHYLDHSDPPTGSPRSTKTAGAPKESTTSKAPIRSEEVSEEVKSKSRRKRSVKTSPPSPLSGLVRWDKESRKVRFEEGGSDRLKAELEGIAQRESLSRPLTTTELQEGWGRLNGHLIGNPFKTGGNTLPAFVLNWFENDMRRKNNGNGRVKPLAQRIDEKVRERMGTNGNSGNSSEIAGITRQLLESGRVRRHS